MDNAIEVIGLRKSYGDRQVLKGLDLTIPKGVIFSLLGVNGAGKTTALECIEGLRKYDSGQVRLFGKSGIQLQSAALPEYIRPMEAVRLFSIWNNCAPDRAALEALGIDQLGKTTYRHLSVGQKRRLHLALALTGDPDVIFLDEPTAGLDVEARAALHKLIFRLREAGKTIVLASHDMAEVEALSNLIAILHEGHIIFLGTVRQLEDKLGRLYNVKVITASGTLETKTGDISGTLLSILSSCKKQGQPVLDVRVDRGTLEEHFVELTKEASQ